MDTDNSKRIWTIKGATLSDKNARKEYGISQEEIVAGMSEGKLQYRINYIHGNPYYKLIKKEIESYILEKHGPSFLEKNRLTFSLNQVSSELRKLKRQMNRLNKEKDDLKQKLEELEDKL